VRGRLSVIAVLMLGYGAAFLPALLPQEDSTRLNVLVVVTDDQSWDSIPRSVPVMPFLQERVLDPADHWVVFSNGFVNTPLCCPARTTMLTGGYAHHTGVEDNADGRLIDESATLAAWLDGAGYHTGLVGKYLNLYPFGRGPYVPEGWDRWWGRVQGGPETLYRGFTLVEQGEPVTYSRTAADYSTDVFATKALEFLDDAPSDEPFFLWFAPTAPHPPVVPAARHAGRYADLVVPTPPSLGETDVSDKPAWVRDLLAFDAEDLAEVRDERRVSFEALLGVDEAMRGIIEELRAIGELDETVIVYVSDNGFSFGEHRWVKKTCPYEECIRVPFLLRLPDVEHRIEPAMVSVVDLAPTIAELVRVTPDATFDGVSLVPLLLEDSHEGRTGEVFAEWVGDDRIPAWWELRRSAWTYIELATGERELYDMRRDPYQLVNLAADPTQSGRIAAMSAALAAYRDA